MGIDWKAKIELVSKLYSPTTPIKEEIFFRGRSEQLNKINFAVQETGQHIIIYGDRGVGKTSLANIVGERYRAAINSLVTCNQNSTLSGLWKSIFKRVPISIQRYKRIGFQLIEESENQIQSITTLADQLDPQREIDIDDINLILAQANDIGYKFLFIFDEFDQIKNNKLIADFSNIIKYSSDHLENITIMIVGIGKSVSDLIENHHSIERSTVQIFLQRMSDRELEEIISKANIELDMDINKDVLEQIVMYSSGYPHYTHLLGKYSTLNSLQRESLHIDCVDFNKAVDQAIENANESIRSAYEKAVITSKSKSLFPTVLVACALVKTDEHGTFRLTDIKGVLEKEFDLHKDLQAYQYHIGKLCTEDRGNILEKINVSGSLSKYKFSNPLFKSYVILKHYRNKCDK